MSLLTTWGYELPDAESLPDIISVEEFNTATANRYAGDTRISPGIKAASLALRNRCGWHLTGSLSCKITWTVMNRGIIKHGSDLMIQLPAKFVSGITSVAVAGTNITDFSFQTNGLLTVYDAPVCGRRDVIEVVYTAGIPDASEIKEMVAQMVTMNVAKSYGVTSEAAGGVSITYNSAWTNGSFNQIMDNNAGLLMPYKLEGVF